MIAKDLLGDIINSKIDSSPEGIQCSFIPLNDKWGIKVYSCKSTRDYAYINQKKCLEIGLAPELGDKIDLDDKTYCYITERVWTFPCLDSDMDRRRFLLDHTIEELEVALKEIDMFEDHYLDSGLSDIVDEIWEKTGWRFIDDHVFNWGKKDGNWIPIDFG